MAAIGASVGKGGVNNRPDVITVQQLLQPQLPALGLAPFSATGNAGPRTIEAIRLFQARVVGLSAPDGRIDPGGKTWKTLSANAPAAPAATPAPAPAPSGPVPLSGADWWHANQAGFPNSAKLEDLVDPFRRHVGAFIDALRAAGASVTISSTLRNENRAKLMRYSWQVSRGTLSPGKVPAIPGCAINWDHGDTAASRKAAQQMVDLFGIAFQPSLTSLHIFGRAIDMTITWNGNLAIRDANGGVHSIGAPRNGNQNAKLHAVGATYGAKKLVSDPPHWSDTGH